MNNCCKETAKILNEELVKTYKSGTNFLSKKCLSCGKRISGVAFPKKVIHKSINL